MEQSVSIQKDNFPTCYLLTLAIQTAECIPIYLHDTAEQTPLCVIRQLVPNILSTIWPEHFVPKHVANENFSLILRL